jgi:glycosyltransferase involved in cell wall biosynthesis
VRLSRQLLDEESDASVNVLILNPDLPVFPGRAGHEFLQATRLRQLGHVVGIVSLLHTREQDEKKQALLDAGVELYLWRSPDLISPGTGDVPVRRGGGLVRRLLRRLVVGVRPSDTYVQDHQFRNIAPAIIEALAARDWHVLVVVQSSCARWLDFLPRFPASALVLHDVRALLFERRAAIERRWHRRVSARLEALRYRRFEAAYARRYGLVVTVSAADGAWVQQRYAPALAATVPIPVDIDYFTPGASSPGHPRRVVFTGMMNHPPNTDAAVFFARDVWPGVLADAPDAEFWIVGRDPTGEVLALDALPGVRVTGFVDDIRPYIRDAGVVVVPLRFGSGMRNKILEAWAMEKCIVSTSVGAEGLEYVDRENILIADDADTLRAGVVAALGDPGLRSRLTASGRRCAAQHDALDAASRYAGELSRSLRAARPSRAPHTLVDLRWMRPGDAGGIEVLSRCFLAELFSFDRTSRYTLLLPSSARYEIDTRQNPNVDTIAVDGPGSLWRRGSLLVRNAVRGAVGSDVWRSPEVERLRFAHRIGADLALSIPGYIHPDLHPFTNLLVVPDIQHEECPEFFPQQALDERRRIYRDAIGRARHIFAISDFTRRTLIGRLNVPEEKITVTPLAADPLFLPGSPARGRRDEVLRKYGLTPGGYFLFPGNTWIHKNHRTAVDAMQRLCGGRTGSPLLVCIGAAREAQELLDARIDQMGLRHQIRFLGYCPSADLPGLYEGARALLFPSLYEGFGMPVLEAMWCDCPVVCSNTTSLPEIAGDAAVLVPPSDPDAIAAALERVSGDEDLRRDLVARGRRRAATYSWRRFATTVAARLADTYRSRWEPSQP